MPRIQTIRVGCHCLSTVQKWYSTLTFFNNRYKDFKPVPGVHTLGARPR